MRWLGRIGYADGLALQAELVARRRRGEGTDALLLLEHPPVVTIGRSSDRAHLLAGPDELARRGIELHEAGRGGDVTYHGPGQLVGYPVVALPADRRDAHRYLRDLEEALIRAVAGYDIEAGRVEGLTGVWVGDLKLGAIGVRLNTGWITSHGFALNVASELDNFSTIVPCGIGDRGVTSIEDLTGRAPALTDVAARVAGHLAQLLGLAPAVPDDPAECLAIDDAQPLSWFERDPAGEPGEPS